MRFYTALRRSLIAATLLTSTAVATLVVAPTSPALAACSGYMCTLNTAPSITGVNLAPQTIGVGGWTFQRYDQVYVQAWDATTGAQIAYAYGYSNSNANFYIPLTAPGVDGVCYTNPGTGRLDPVNVQAYDYQTGRWSNVYRAVGQCYNW